MIVIIKLLKYREEWGDNTHKECNVFTTIFVCCITVILLLLCVIWGLKTHLCVLESCSVISNSLWPHGILQARILKWVAFPFSRGSSQPRYQTQVSHIAGRFFTSWVTREALLTLSSKQLLLVADGVTQAASPLPRGTQQTTPTGEAGGRSQPGWVHLRWGARLL